MMLTRGQRSFDLVAVVWFVVAMPVYHLNPPLTWLAVTLIAVGYVSQAGPPYFR